MDKQPKTFYKYRAFSTKTLDDLCNDTLYFAHPGNFNDPLDCKPTVKCDTDLQQLRELLAHLIRQRVSTDALTSLRQAHLQGENATLHANKLAHQKANDVLANIAYNATNPDYSCSVEESEERLLGQEIERKLLKYYGRGVCCFSIGYSDPLLWSHYGDHHRGLCIGYGTNRKPKPELQKVLYGGNRTIQTSTINRALVHNDHDAKHELDRDVLLRKAKGWGYEREWRLIGEQGLQDSPLLLKEITFGLRCPWSVMHAVVQALSGRRKPVRFYETYAVHDRYMLRRQPLNISELSSCLPKTAASGIEIFGPAEE